MNLGITKIIILSDPHRTDRVFLETVLPSPFPFIDQYLLSLSFEVMVGYGLEYVHTHFHGIPVQFISMETGKNEDL